MAFETFKITAFRGVDQSRGVWGEPGASPDAVNMICRKGALMTWRAPAATEPAPPAGCARLFQGFFRDQNGADSRTLVAAGGGHVWALTGGAWHELGSGFQSDDWCAVNYRHEDEDWLILVNGLDPMQRWDGQSAALSPVDARMGGVPVRFERLTLIYERLWGAVTAGQPDRVYWSESFAPDNWELNAADPDTGGGFMDVATFDGARIRAVVAAFDDVLIFKDRSMHRLNGTYPGDFSLTQVYGSEGTLAARTIVHTASRLYFLGGDGLCAYDGMTVSSLTHGGDSRMKDVFARVNQQAVKNACAALWRDVIYLALPLDGANGNTHVVRYALSDGGWALLSLPGVRDFLIWREGQDERLLCLTGDGLYRFGEGPDALPGAYWTTPVLPARTAGRRRLGRVCFPIEAEAAGSLTLTALSEDGQVQKTVRFGAGRSVVRQRLRLRGRALRLKLESEGRAMFSLPDGMELEIEEESP
ncbi:MAG: hypothetical protein IKO07_13775 [Clostridia bacterium]|nr:hypothetical protein [Clostridia bacterium]